LKYLNRNFRTRPLLSTGLFLVACLAIANLPAISLAGGASNQAPTVRSTPARGVDGLIAHLHEEFKVTPAQEDLFQKLATVMREDADSMSALAKKRSEGAKTNSAVDDLKSYAEIAEAHADGAKRMIPVFQALYDSMSDTQKQAADIEFREHYATHHHHKH
jgi:LTXXQ motif family protein